VIEDAIALARVHAPLLAVAAPIAGAALCIVTLNARFGWIIGVFASLISAAIATDLAARALVFGAPLRTAAEGVALVPDRLGAFAAGVVSVAALLAAIGAGARASASRDGALTIVLVLLSAAGWLAAAYTTNALVLMLGTEIAWLAGVGVVALGGEGKRTPLNAAARMLSVGAVGVAFSMVGLALIADATGTLSLSMLAENLSFDSQPFSVGFALVLGGVALKAGVAPFHLWVGAAFTRANAATLLAVGCVSAAGALLAIVRVVSYGVVAPEFGAAVFWALAPLGVACVVIGSVQAIGARDLRRLIAYALTAQMGGVMLCVSLGSPAGFAAGLIQITAIVGAGLALFGAATVSESYKVNDIDGLARRAPFSSAAFTFGAASLIGAPMTIGFLGRWRLVEAGVGVDWWWPVGAMTLASLAAVFYGGQLIERVYFRRAQEVQARSGDRWRYASFPALAAGVIVIALGLAPQALLAAADAAAMVAP